jgi:hypothetical protein
MGRAAAAVSAPSRQRKKSAPARRSSGSANGRTGAHTRPRAAAGARKASAARAVAAPQAVPRRAPRTRTAPKTKPRTRTAPLIQRAARGRFGAALDWVLRGRACVFLFGALLAGVVFFNVSLLEKNEGIARTNAKATAIAHENQLLRRKLAKLDSSERIQTEAVKRGFSLPAAGDVGYFGGDVNANAKRAAERIVAPGTGTGTASRAIGTDHDVTQGGPTTQGATAAPEPTTVQPQTQAPVTTPQAQPQPTPQPQATEQQVTTPGTGTGAGDTSGVAAPGTTATGP